MMIYYEDTLNPLGTLFFHFERFTLDSGAIAFRITDSLLKRYPNWNNLKERKAALYSEFLQRDFKSAIRIREELMKINYGQERQISAIKLLRLVDKYQIAYPDSATHFFHQYLKIANQFKDDISQ